jgi:hypothetical protein
LSQGSVTVYFLTSLAIALTLLQISLWKVVVASRVEDQRFGRRRGNDYMYMYSNATILVLSDTWQEHEHLSRHVCGSKERLH